MKMNGKSFDRGENGSAFITVVILTAILMIAGVSLTFLTSNASHVSRKINDGARALAIAEAGVADQVVKMSTNGGSGYTYWASGVSNVGSFDSGTFVVYCARPSGSPNVDIYSIGTVNRESRMTVLELLNAGTVDGALIAGGNCTLDTSAMTVNGDVHANGNIFNSQGNPTINGDIEAAGGTIQLTPGAGHTANPNAPTFSVLDSIADESPPIAPPFDWWRSMATNGGLYYSTNQSWAGTTIATTNGVVFVQGNAAISGRSRLTGTLVATGSITVDNQFEGQTLTNTNWPAFLAGFNVNLDNRNNIPGLIFAGNDIEVSNNRDIRGKLIAMNNISIKNRGIITPPPSGAAGYPQVNIGGWLR